MNEELFQKCVEEDIADGVVEGRLFPPEMLRDLHAISDLGEETCQLVSETLKTYKKLDIEGTLADALQDVNLASCITNILSNIDQNEIDLVLTTLKAWTSESTSRRQLFNIERMDRLSRNLELLVTDYQSVALMNKADQLLRDVGNEFQDVKFVCDLRPVFNQEKTGVEAFIQLANLRLRYLSQDGAKHSCEIALTRWELELLIEHAQLAISKLETLDSFCTPETTLREGH